MKRAIALALLALLLLASAFAETGWYGETAMREVNVRAKPDQNAKKVVTISKKGSRVELLGTEIGADGKTWYEVQYTSAKNNTYTGWIRGDLVEAGERPAVSADTWQAAYAQVLQAHRVGIEAYQAFQEQEYDFLREYEGDVTCSPLYVMLLDLTGDGQEELLFLCADLQDRDPEWYGEVDDLYVYTWNGTAAEQALYVPNVYVYAGNGPWYNICLEKGAGALYLNYGCNGPGRTERYTLSSQGVYEPALSAEALFLDEDETDNGYLYYVDGERAAEAAYEAAIESLETTEKELLASSEMRSEYTILTLREALDYLAQ